MKTEEIEKAAEKSYDDMVGSEDDYGYNKDLYIVGFLDGAEWHSENIWHSVEEKPKPLSRCLIEYIDEEVDEEFTNYEVTHYTTDNVGFIGDVKSKKIIRWAYVEDLLPIKFK